MTNFQVEKREWWVERWLELLNSYRFKKRLERGRNYAREGNVLNIDFADSKAKAVVQGSETEPYRVSLFLESFSDEDWDYAIAKLAEKAIFSAQLLAGEMPETIEAVFTASGLSLFPFALTEVRSRCSCPDKANPCKHIAAVYYQLGDRFSEDPFIIFQLRGRTKNQIIERLRQIRSQTAAELEAVPLKESLKMVDSAVESEPIVKSDNKSFWQYDEPLESSLVAIVPPINNKTVLDILGNIPLPAADADAVQQYLTQVYQTAGQQALMSALNREQ
ncbi:SWIM zinc finger family protein [Pleurocapsa sp. PCC 7319]|uniref:SWIM zinc finger family protein n=1 Tax=Pleurocapsa sp. PCC 7319 TaxID=118161 RepID=UPI000346E539|nr:SWIM zinc finger family protein [Pleurocapsa sp. PCC 7319]